MTGRPRTPLAERFWPKVDKHGPRAGRLGRCWVWTGDVDGYGYGQIRAGGSSRRRLKAHRVAYELVVGAIPAGLELDHLCRRHDCVRPSHVEAVTHQENVLRGLAPTVLAHNAGLCANGHDLATEAYRRKSTGAVVYCRACRRERRAASRGRCVSTRQRPRSRSRRARAARARPTARTSATFARS